MLRRSFILISFLLGFTVLMAQRNKPATPKAPVSQKFKAPKTRTLWGNHSDSSTVTVDEALSLLKLPLTIIDENKLKYGIKIYHFLYRKRGVTEDEETGKVTPTTTISSDLFKVTPLPESWIESVSQQLRSGEELYFFDVIAKDAQGHIFFAPTLKIKIK